MVDLLMLGIIPGTNIQIDFADWLLASTLFSGCLLGALAYRQRRALLAACRPGVQLVSRHAWLLVLRVQLSWQLR